MNEVIRFVPISRLREYRRLGWRLAPASQAARTRIEARMRWIGEGSPPEPTP